MTAAASKVSFLGMGIMGSAMAFNLLKAGHPLRVWNRSPERPALAALAQAGALVTTDLGDCVNNAEVIFTCLGDETDVLNRLCGDSGDSVLSALDGSGRQPVGKPSQVAVGGPLIVDFSTIGPATARIIGARLEGGGLRFLDAPVTGGDVGAKNGTLTIMVGGRRPDFEQVLPLLEVLGKNIRYCGEAGAGQALKLCNQVLCAVNMISVSEALTLATDLGIEPALVVDVLQTGAGGSWALANLGKRILQDDLAPAFSIRNMLKDLRLVFDSLEKESDICAAHLPGTTLSAALFDKVAKISADAGDTYGTQAMIQAYKADL